MKLDILGLPLGARQKRIFAAVAAISVTILGAAAIGYAGPTLHVWKDGDTLTAADLNGNFTALDTRIAALEENSPTYLVAESKVTESSAVSQDLVYQSISLDLTPGTWLVEGFASLSTTVSQDGVQMSLWDDTNSVEVTQSRSPMVSTIGFGGVTSCDGITTFCTSVGVTTSRVITVASETTIRLKGHRNGASRIWFGSSDPNGSVVLPWGHRLTALRLK
jgi:hypothetical protein